MSLLFFIVCLNVFFYVEPQIYECPKYELLKKPRRTQNEKFADKNRLQCNLVLANPKKVINPYRNEVQNIVQSKPFASVCVKCSMCLAIAGEMDKVFREVSEDNRETKQTQVVELLNENIKNLCHNGFENYDLRKFKEYQIVTDDFTCSTHVRTKMDGRWTEKLREICAVYSSYMDFQILLNGYLKGSDDISRYLCSNNGIFRDCSSLNFKNTSINPEQKSNTLLTC